VEQLTKEATSFASKAELLGKIAHRGAWVLVGVGAVKDGIQIKQDLDKGDYVSAGAHGITGGLGTAGGILFMVPGGQIPGAIMVGASIGADIAMGGALQGMAESEARLALQVSSKETPEYLGRQPGVDTSAIKPHREEYYRLNLACRHLGLKDTNPKELYDTLKGLYDKIKKSENHLRTVEFILDGKIVNDPSSLLATLPGALKELGDPSAGDGAFVNERTGQTVPTYSSRMIRAKELAAQYPEHAAKLNAYLDGVFATKAQYARLGNEEFESKGNPDRKTLGQLQEEFKEKKQREDVQHLEKEFSDLAAMPLEVRNAYLRKNEEFLRASGIDNHNPSLGQSLLTYDNLAVKAAVLDNLAKALEQNSAPSKESKQIRGVLSSLDRELTISVTRNLDSLRPALAQSHAAALVENLQHSPPPVPFKEEDHDKEAKKRLFSAAMNLTRAEKGLRKNEGRPGGPDAAQEYERARQIKEAYVHSMIPPLKESEPQDRYDKDMAKAAAAMEDRAQEIWKTGKQPPHAFKWKSDLLKSHEAEKRLHDAAGELARAELHLNPGQGIPHDKAQAFKDLARAKIKTVQQYLTENGIEPHQPASGIIMDRMADHISKKAWALQELCHNEPVVAAVENLARSQMGLGSTDPIPPEKREDFRLSVNFHLMNAGGHIQEQQIRTSEAVESIKNDLARNKNALAAHIRESDVSSEFDRLIKTRDKHPDLMRAVSETERKLAKTHGKSDNEADLAGKTAVIKAATQLERASRDPHDPGMMKYQQRLAIEGELVLKGIGENAKNMCHPELRSSGVQVAVNEAVDAARKKLPELLRERDSKLEHLKQNVRAYADKLAEKGGMAGLRADELEGLENAPQEKLMAMAKEKFVKLVMDRANSDYDLKHLEDLITLADKKTKIIDPQKVQKSSGMPGVASADGNKLDEITRKLRAFLKEAGIDPNGMDMLNGGFSPKAPLLTAKQQTQNTGPAPRG